MKNLLEFFTLEQMLQTLPTGLFLVDNHQNITYWNTEAERITGYSADQAVGRHCSFLEGIPCGRSCGLFEESIPKPLIGVPCKIKARDGRSIYLLKNVDYLRDEDGKIVGGVEAFIDSTEQKECETELRREKLGLEKKVRQRTAQINATRKRLRDILDAMVDPAYIVGYDHHIEFANRAMEKTFGPLRGKICHKTFFGFSAPCPWCPMPQVRKGKSVCQERFYETVGRTFELCHSPLKDEDGHISKLAVFRDITERKEAEKRLLAANRELDDFVRTIAHDMRSPLSPIIGFAEFLRDNCADRLDEQGLDMLDEIEKQGLKALDLLEDLLKLSQVGQLEPPAKAVDLTRLVREIQKELRAPIGLENVTVQLAPLPPLALPETLLSQLFANLISNAVRYAGSAGSPIEVGGKRSKERIRYFVRDHGPGIPEKERERIFDVFYRGSTRGKTPGTGIGLATVRKIVRLYNGRIWVEETPGGGSTFWIEFPLSKSS